MVLGAGAFGSAAVVVCEALLPWSFRLNVFALLTFSFVASVVSRAFMILVDSPFRLANSIILSFTALL